MIQNINLEEPNATISLLLFFWSLWFSFIQEKALMQNHQNPLQRCYRNDTSKGNDTLYFFIDSVCNEKFTNKEN